MVEKKIKTLTKELKAMVADSGSSLTMLSGVGAIVAARVLVEVGDVTRFADRNRFASWTGTAPLDASSGEHDRHRLSRAGNRKMNHMLHIAAATQVRLDTPGRGYYRRKLAEGKTRKEAMRCLKDGSPTPSTDSSSPTPAPPTTRTLARAREGTAGRLKNPARSTCPRTSTLRISHFPDPHARRYSPPRLLRTPRGFGSPASGSARRSRQRGAPHRTNDVDGDKR